jgi:four helix bundle protein
MWSLVRFTIAMAREGLYASNDVEGGEAGRREGGKAGRREGGKAGRREGGETAFFEAVWCSYAGVRRAILVRMDRRLWGSYRNLRVWNKAMTLVLDVYRITEPFPEVERFGLTSQLRRAAVSVASNIAEGHARTTRGEYKNFLSIARGSVVEVEVQLTLAEQLGYVQSPAIASALDHCDAVSRMITNMKRGL